MKRVLATVALAIATASVNGQSTSSPAALDVYASDVGFFGQVYVARSGANATVVTTINGSLFSLVDETLVAPKVPDSPIAFVNFENFGTSCGTHANVVFSTTNSNKCSSRGPFFKASNGRLVFGSQGGTFQVCSPGFVVSYDTSGVTKPGCTNIELFFAD